MRETRRAAHTVYSLHYHFVFITKYRKLVLRGDVGTEVRDLIREICRSNDIEIWQGLVRPDHVPSVTERPAAPVAEPRDAGDLGKDLPSPPGRSSKAAGRVLGAAPVGPWVLRRE